jgi:ABC-type Fe3+ transport system permease subunit
MGTTYGLLQSGSLATLLLVFAIALLYLNQWYVRRHSFQTVSGKVSRPSLIELGAATKWCLVAVFVFINNIFAKFWKPVEILKFTDYPPKENG